MPSTDPPAEVMSERTAVYLWRYEQARRAGLNRLEARLFAESDLDLQEFRRDAERIPREWLARIVL